MSSNDCWVLFPEVHCQELLASEGNALFAGKSVEQAIRCEHDEVVSLFVYRNESDFRLIKHEVLGLLLLSLFVCNLNLFALEVSEGSSYSQPSENPTEDDEASLALYTLLLILTRGFVIH